MIFFTEAQTKAPIVLPRPTVYVAIWSMMNQPNILTVFEGSSNKINET